MRYRNARQRIGAYPSGAGGFGREVKMLIDQINEVEKKWNFVGFFDDADDIKPKIIGFIIFSN